MLLFVLQMDDTVPAISAKHEVEKAQMRKWVVTSILDSERGYVSMLDVLLQVNSLSLFFPLSVTSILDSERGYISMLDVLLQVSLSLLSLFPSLSPVSWTARQAMSACWMCYCS